MTPDTLRALCEQATPGPYFTAPDPSPNHADHKDSGLAKLETGRQGDWPPAMLMEWPQADYFAACSPDLIAKLCDLWAAAEDYTNAIGEQRAMRRKLLHDALAALQEEAE